jgi:hypothetical protein
LTDLLIERSLNRPVIFMNTTLYAKFSSAPLEMKVFSIFSVIVTMLGCALPVFGPEHLWEAVVPFTGWLPGLGYMFGLFFTFALIYSKLPPGRLRIGIIAPLALQIIFGLLVMAKQPANNFGNPYLTVSPWQPVWTIVIPALWIAMLFTPRMGRFCKVTDNNRQLL